MYRLRSTANVKVLFGVQICEDPMDATPTVQDAEFSAAPSLRDSPERFLNRELSWLAFDKRVLEEAQNPRHPLLERVRFLSITSSNLDEFFMIRVAGLKQQVLAGVSIPGPDGLTPSQQLAAVRERVHEMMLIGRSTWHMLRKELRENGIAVIDAPELTPDEHEWLREKFLADIFPILTPLAMGPTHSFPFILNRGIALAVQMFDEGTGRDLDALVPIPFQLDRFVLLPGNEMRFIPLEQVILQFLKYLFPPFELRASGVFRILRDSDLEIDDIDIEEDGHHLMMNIESALKRRRRGNVIRLNASDDMSPELLEFLKEELGVDPEDVSVSEGLIGLVDIKQLIVDARPDLLFTPYTARFPERIRDFGGDCFAAIQAKDIIIHHPYESFDVVVQFLRQAAHDPDVVAIKQTLYRTSKDSPIVRALIEAAEAGKSVIASVELQARFDEEANLRWARDLERAGAQVVFGFVDIKIHAKTSLVVRREGGTLRSYVHYGTGNYHPVTAKIYTDLSFFTCDPILTTDAQRMFNFMTGYARPDSLEKLAISPINLRKTICELIEAEIEHARHGRPAHIWAKINSLVDPDMIDLLYRASAAGVEIDLIVRGICCLRPGVPGLSERIRVRSLVGRFLEHARIVAFGAGHAMPSKHMKLFISSADWMQRNLDHRIETLVPLENPTVRQQVFDQILVANMKDDMQSWQMQPDGAFIRIKPGRNPFSAHNYFMTNPSLSGRGSAMHETRNPPRLQLKSSS
jgi:polyphosphate kinase